ncbi:hyalin-like [Anneissia japonica]|uniref:hyalin-like n=1 Tax=Anneissia japonica TaxID=1529436 RepID=UPI0014256E4D|nr:hyalin-like [Anneissia japonica]
MFSDNPCLLEPCVNGECYLLNNIATCDCTGTGYGGTACEQDIENPVLTCPGNYSADTPPGEATKTVEEFNVTVEDNSGETPVITSDFPVNGTFGIGLTVVTYQATDSSGNGGMCTVTVTIYDMENPNITCPTSETVMTDDGLPTAVYNYTVVVLDNSDEDISPVCSMQSGFPFPIGETIVECNATDSSNNFASCSFMVDVEDQEPPVINCPSNIFMQSAVGVSSLLVIWDQVNATDNSQNPPTITSNYNSNDSFPLGITEVNFNATDGSGNLANCSFTVTIEAYRTFLIVIEFNAVDGVPYSFTEALLNSSSTQYIELVSKLCESVSNISTLCEVKSFTNGSVIARFELRFSQGTIYTVDTLEAEVNSSTSQVFHVLDINVVDCEPPVLECPSNQNVNGDSDCMATALWAEPNVTDNSGESFSAVCDYMSGDTFFELNTTVTCNATDDYDNTGYCIFNIFIIGDEFEIGENVVTYTGTDCNENSGSCNFTIVVLDCEAPVLNCSQDLTFYADDDCQSYVNWTDVTASDNYDSEVNVFCNPTEGIFDMDNYTVTCNATDMAGNTGNCSFDFYIFDAISPNVTCPDDITVDTDVGVNTANVICICY